MKRSTMFLLLTLILAAYAALFLAAWSASAHRASDTGGAEAATMAMENSVRQESEKSSDEKLIFPIRGEYWKTSDFGIRTSPFTGQAAVHYGTDYGAPEGAKIQAVKSGVIVTHWPAPDGYYRGHPVYGGFIEILHDDGLSRYAHMSETFGHEGDLVEAGQVIGIIGNTGKTSGKTGRHLHFEYMLSVESLLP